MKSGVDAMPLFLLDHLLNENKKICFLNLLTFSAQGRGLAPIFGDVSQSERLSEIKPPLALKASYRRPFHKTLSERLDTKSWGKTD